MPELDNQEKLKIFRQLPDNVREDFLLKHEFLEVFDALGELCWKASQWWGQTATVFGYGKNMERLP